MTVRCKFTLSKITQHAGSGGKTLEFTATYDQSIPEDQLFFKYTPSGTFTMYVDNPPVVDKLELGGAYYFDITPAPK
jgi:hypothetical protein